MKPANDQLAWSPGWATASKPPRNASAPIVITANDSNSVCADSVQTASPANGACPAGFTFAELMFAEREGAWVQGRRMQSRALANSGVELAKAYAILDDVSRTELGDHVWRFEMRRPGHDHDNEHPHFVCVDCGEVSCLPDVQVNISPSPGTKRSGISDVTEVLLRGHCGRCS